MGWGIKSQSTGIQRNMMIRLIRSGLFFLLSLYSYNALAIHCMASTGTYLYNYTLSVDSTQNTVGYSTAWQSKSASGTYTISGGCSNRATYYSGTPSSSMTLASSDSDGTTWYNLADNNYLQVASQIGIYNMSTGSTPYQNVPFTDISNNCNDQCSISSPAASGSQVNIKLKIKKKFVGASFIVNEPIAYLYANQGGTGLGQGTPIVQINLNATMSVPQSCTINAGTVVEFDFGNISAQSFARAGAGQKPDNTNVMTKSVGITCNNISAQSMMTMRLEATNVSGNAVVSNNADVGFILATSSGTPLKPNNTSSVLPFTLDSNAAANVVLESWPVSITGKQPSAGTATATGYLRVDFQ